MGKPGDCGTGMGEYPESSDSQVLSYPGNDNEKIKCNQLPAMGVAERQGTADKAGFELLECENPTDVCATYCVHVKPSPLARKDWTGISRDVLTAGMCVSMHQPDHGSLCATTYDPAMFFCHAGSDGQVTCRLRCAGERGYELLTRLLSWASWEHACARGLGRGASRE